MILMLVLLSVLLCEGIIRPLIVIVGVGKLVAVVVVATEVVAVVIVALLIKFIKRTLSQLAHPCLGGSRR